MIKLIAADMDGTLIDKTHGISSENCSMIRKAQKCGIRFVVATGRLYNEVSVMLKQYDISCECITMNGAEYYDKSGTCIEGIYFNKNKAKEIFNFMQNENKFALEVYTDQGCYTVEPRLKFLYGFMKRARIYHTDYNFYQKIFYALRNTHFRQVKHIKNIEDFLASKLNIAKFVSYSDNESDIAALKERFKSINDVAVSGSFTTNIEVNDALATKGNSIKKIAMRENIKEDEIMVIGDGLNDMSMFKNFPTNSIAMGNAIPEIKNVASSITADCNNSGVAMAIKNILDQNQQLG